MYRRRGYSGLPTTFGAAWGRPVTVAGDVGGRWHRPDGSSPDELRGLIVYLHGYGGNRTEILSRLASSEFRAAHRGSGFHVLSLQGTFTLGGSNRTWNGNDALLPQNTSYPWATSTAYAVGDRRTANGNTYMRLIAGTSAASGTGPSGISYAIDDGAVAGAWRCVAVGTHDNVMPDIDFVAGIGRTVAGVVLPEGVVREFLRTSGCRIDRSRIALLAYSTGGGLADSLVRHHSDVFTHCVDLAGCGPNTASDHNWAAPFRKRHRIHWHGTTDVTVNYNGVPAGTSSAAVGNHPSGAGTLNQFCDDSGMVGSAVAASGITVDFTSTAGQEAALWLRHTTAWATSTAYAVGVRRRANSNTYLCITSGTSAASGTGPSGTGSSISDGSAAWKWVPADEVDADHGGFSVRAQFLSGTGDGHIPTMNNNGHRYTSSFIDENPGTPG